MISLALLFVEHGACIRLQQQITTIAPRDAYTSLMHVPLHTTTSFTH